MHKRSHTPIGTIVFTLLLLLAGFVLPSAPRAETLPAPTLSAVVQSGPQVRLSWTQPKSTISGFEIQRSLDPTSGYATIMTVGKSTLAATDSKVTAGTGYYYRVRSFKTAVSVAYSAYSNVVFADVPAAASVAVIAPVAAPGSFQFGASNYSVNENAGYVDVAIQRVGGSDGTVGVKWGTQSVSATLNVDYVGVSWTDLVFASGETSKVVRVNLVSDNIVEADETFKVLLGTPSGGATLGSPIEALVTIKDAPYVDTVPPTVNISAPAGGTTITSAQTISVTASAQDNVGVGKVEFYVNGVLKATDTSYPYAYAWAVTSANNGSYSLVAKAYDAAGNVASSSPVSVAVNIAVAAPGSFQFAAGNYSVNENAGYVDVAIQRVGGSDGTVGVKWGTQSVSATLNVDYVGVSWTDLVFASGETSKVVRVNILSDNLTEADETFKVLLGTPSGGATLGTPIEALVTIKDAPYVDTVPPTVSISAPTAATTITSAQTVSMTASAQDDVGVGKVEFYVNGVLKATDTSSPYAYAWALTSANNGTYSLVAKAYDAAGNVATSSPVSVTVNIAEIVQSGPLRVFPSAQGYGTETVAGRGGKIIKVTNLNDSGTGSLRAAVEATGPRIVVFEVSGVINLANFIQIRNPYLTIAGQTAPSPGITIKGKGIFDIRTHNVLIQHLRLRAGDPNGTSPAGYEDGFQITGSTTSVYNIVIDHVSCSWALDENGAIWAADNVTVSNSIFSESIAGYKGFLIGNNADNITFHNNLVMQNTQRHPRINAGTSVVMFNNLFYSIGVGAHTEIGQTGTTLSTPNPDHAALVSAVGNVYLNKPGTSKMAFNVFTSTDHAINTGTKLFLKDNLIDGAPVGSSHITYKTTDPRVSVSPLSLSAYTIIPASQVEARLIQSAGARPADRDLVDQRVITQLMGRSGSIPTSVAALGSDGWPSLASAVSYRTFNAGTNPNGDDDGDGYTNVEEILHAMARALEL